MSILGRFSKKDLPKKQSFDLPQSVIDLIETYIKFGAEKGIEVDKNELAALCFTDTLSREKDFQSWLKNQTPKAE
ncbi:MAG TPA: hypothetical protein PKY82_02400 [Pyrinomonadaceae bacterium]|nr:hypothetical protein [Pyrinomonadaceae bacterium]